jgi:hypothetical protein
MQRHGSEDLMWAGCSASLAGIDGRSGQADPRRIRGAARDAGSGGETRLEVAPVVSMKSSAMIRRPTIRWWWGVLALLWSCTVPPELREAHRIEGELADVEGEAARGAALAVLDDLLAAWDAVAEHERDAALRAAAADGITLEEAKTVADRAAFEARANVERVEQIRERVRALAAPRAARHALHGQLEDGLEAMTERSAAAKALLGATERAATAYAEYRAKREAERAERRRREAEAAEEHPE